MSNIEEIQKWMNDLEKEFNIKIDNKSEFNKESLTKKKNK